MSSLNLKSPKGQHGGNLSWISATYPHAPLPFIDLSTGINPYGYPVPALDARWHYRMPDAALTQAACEAAAAYYRAPGVDNIALAGGMQPLLVALAALRLREYGISDAAVVTPAYSEHESIWGALGHRCSPCAGIGATGSDVVIVCNPNNPDGRTVAPELLLQKAKQLAVHGGWLVVDESFADLAPGLSVAGAVQEHGNLIVLRSCGKFFGVAGMRVSAVAAASAFTGKLRVLLGPWPVSTAACHLLPVMLRDGAWADAMRHRLSREAAEWRNALADYFTIAGYTPLFTLVETPRAGDWQNHLAAHGLLVRRFDYNPRWLRFGLLDVSHMARVRAALSGGPA